MYSPEDFRKVRAFNVVEESVPRTHDEATKSANAALWIAAEQTELKAMQDYGTYEAVADVGQKRLNCKWVYAIKKDERGQVVKFKARLVV